MIPRLGFLLFLKVLRNLKSKEIEMSQLGTSLSRRALGVLSLAVAMCPAIAMASNLAGNAASKWFWLTW